MLLDNSCYPTTGDIGFTELPLAEAVAACKTMWPPGRLRQRHLTGSLRDFLDHLLPLTTGRVRLLWVQTAGRWTAYFDSTWLGSDVFPIIPNLSEAGRCGGMRVCTDARGTIWTVYGPDGGTIRHISVAEESASQWEFRQDGDPFPSEETASPQSSC